MGTKRSHFLCGALCGALLSCQTGHAWSNRGHRMINLVAAETLPGDMPAFMRTSAGVAEIAYLGPEPDRWRPNIAPDLNRASSSDHFFRYEAAAALGPLPRRRYDYLQLLDERRARHPELKAQLTALSIGTLPWGVEEVYERLVCAFFDYRLVTGDIPAIAGVDMEPMTKADLPQIKEAALYYAGWLGHYVGDGSMPLHASIHIHGWAGPSNPNSYNTRGSIHHQFEALADDAIAADKVTAKEVEGYIPAPHPLGDSFSETLDYLRREGAYAEQVYRLDKQGGLTGTGTPEADEFIAQRMAEGSAMLRDLIYSAWLQSKLLQAPATPDTVTLQERRK